MSETLKWVSLALMLVQNAVTPLIFRLATTSAAEAERYSAAVAVTVAEFLKLILSFLLISVESNYSIPTAIETVYRKIILRPNNTFRLAIPATLYFIQNVLLQKASANLPAALFQVTYQGKTLVVAFCSVILLQKQLTRMKWLAIVMMAAGIAVVQLANTKEGKQSSMANASEQSITNGLVFVALGCFCSGFAGVYFEMMMKMSSASSDAKGQGIVVEEKPSMWVRNMQLAAFSLLIGIVPILYEGDLKFGGEGEDSSIGFWSSRGYGLLKGFNNQVWLMVCNNAFGGLCVAFVIKYADNILKGFACALATIVAAIASVPLFGFQLSLMFFVGMIVVVFSTLLYGDAVKLKTGSEYWNTEPPICKSFRSASSVNIGLGMSGNSKASGSQKDDDEKVNLLNSGNGKV